MPVTTPRLVSTPFASGAGGAYKNTVPVASQIGVTDGAASYTDGFPPKSMTNVAGGGVAPFGQDFNGVLYDLSTAVTYAQAGMQYTYDSTFSAGIGGYPAGAMVRMSNNLGFWVNTSGAVNTSDPSSGSGWEPLFQSGSTSKTLSGSNVTLTNTEAGMAFIVLSGTLTANVSVIFPTWKKLWVVINSTTGSFTVTTKTSAGTGVVIPQSGATAPTLVYGDGTNIQFGSSTTFASLSGKPTTIAGYGITDAVTTAGGQTVTGQVNFTVPTGLTYSSKITAGPATTDYGAIQFLGAGNSLQAVIGVGNSGATNGAFTNRLGVGTQSAHGLSLITSDTARVSVSAAGNVTINTPSSGDALTVAGNVVAGNISASGHLQSIAGVVYLGAGGTYYLQWDGTNYVFAGAGNLVHSGNIGLQSVSYATNAGYASGAGSAATATSAGTATNAASTASAGNSSLTAASTAFVQNAFPGGAGQSISYPSRAFDTTYTNSSGRAKIVWVHMIMPGNATLVASVNGTDVIGCSGPQVNNQRMSMTFVVPNGATYAVTQSTSASTLTSWAEL